MHDVLQIDQTGGTIIRLRCILTAFDSLVAHKSIRQVFSGFDGDSKIALK